MMGSSQLKCTPSVTLHVGAKDAECWCVSYRGSIPGTGQETSVKPTWHCRVDSSLAILQHVCQEIWDIRDLTLLHVQRELILYLSPNFVSTTRHK